MESLLIVWRLLLLLSLLIFPQLLGVLLYLRLVRFPRWLARILAVLGVVSAFFYLSPIFFFAGLREAQLRGEGCGMPALAATFMVLIGTGFQLFIAVVLQLCLYRRGKAVRVL
jgi:hypothetical protein